MIEASVLSQEWDAALADAGLDRTQTRLYVMNDLGDVHGAGAVWFPPGDEIVADDQFPDASQLRDANAAEHIDLHRMSLRTDDDVAAIAGRMRHELEHARQYDALGRGVFDLQSLVEEALAYRAGGIHGCAGHLINAIPTELDANAAAAMHLRKRHAGEVPRIAMSDARMLACSLVGPEPFDTLPARMVAFGFIHRGRTLDATRSGIPLSERLDDCYLGAAALWAALDSELPSPA